jgi:hypothetical protein
MTLLIVLVAGVIVGRLSSRFIRSSRLADCPKCALEESEQRARIEISGLRHMAKSRMTQAAEGGTRTGAGPKHAAPHKQKGVRL